MVASREGGMSERMSAGKWAALLGLILSCSALLVSSGGAAQPSPWQIYFADAKMIPGSIYRYAYSTTPSGPISSLAIIYTRPGGQLYSFAFHPAVEKLYYVSANETKIYLAARRPTDGQWLGEEVVYTHNTYVRDLAFFLGPPLHPEGVLRLYFSEACGACGNGRIYRIEGDGSITLFYEVRLADVDGSWAGDFAFGPDGTLYLSSGNRVPASIYRVSRGGVERLFTDTTAPIKGFALASLTELYYADWQDKIYHLDLATGRRTQVFSSSRPGWLSDVALPPPGWVP